MLLLFVTFATPAGAQAVDARAEPLRKTDLIRLLTSGSMSPAQIAALVQRNCLSFTPTARDRQNLLALGADSVLLARVDACARARAAGTTRPAAARPPTPPAELVAPPAPVGLVAVPLTTRVLTQTGATASVGIALKRGIQPVPNTRLVLVGSGRLGGDGADALAVTDERGIALFRFAVGSTPGTVRLAVATADGEPLAQQAELDLTTVAPAPPPAPRPAPDRTGFVLGMGQRGRVGETAPLPVVFEVRDSSGMALAGVPVSLAVANGRLVGAQRETDSLGQVRGQVVFGERAGVPTVVTGAVGAIVRQATLYPAAGPPAQLVVLVDGNALAGQVVLRPGRPALLRVFCRDASGNPLPLIGLRATVGDDRVLRVTDVTSDTLGGAITVTAERGGATNLVIQSSGLRADFSALVRP